MYWGVPLIMPVWVRPDEPATDPAPEPSGLAKVIPFGIFDPAAEDPYR